MGVTCQILLDRKPEGIHRAGQAVTGTVRYKVDKLTEYKAVTLSFLGTGKCSWSESDSDNKSTTYHGSEDYITHHINLLNKTHGTSFLNTDTTYEYPFEFHLPEDLPSSFKNSTCTIAYRVQLKFEKPDFFSFNKIFSTEIPVYGFVTPTAEGPVIFGLDKTLVSLFSVKNPVINLKAEIAKSCLTPGENAHLSMLVTNDTDLVPSVKTELYCRTTYKDDTLRTNITDLKVKDCSSDSNKIPPRSNINLSQTIPTSPGLYTIISKVMTKEYRLRVTVKLPMPHVNAIVDMPVVIGERKGLPGVDESVQTLKDTSCELNEVASAAHDVLSAPPSYWEVMREDKEKSERK